MAARVDRAKVFLSVPRGPGLEAARAAALALKRHGLTILLGLLAIGCDSNATRGPALSTNAPAVTADGELFQSCLLCHSTQEMQRGPILDGLPAWYVRRQLEKFQRGIRGANTENRSEALMGAATSVLRDASDVERVAEFISRRPVPAHLKTVRGNVERGKPLYPACVPCHGDAGQGNESVKGPPLNVQEDWYLLDQLRKFKSGLRGAHAWDLEGQVMRVGVMTLPDQDLRDVVAYVAEHLSITNASATGR